MLPTPFADALASDALADRAADDESRVDLRNMARAFRGYAEDDAAAATANDDESAAGRPDPLCCCEYVSHRGERTHLLSICCNCEEFDTAFDKLLGGRGVSSDSFDAVLADCDDRMRCPNPMGGASRVGVAGVVPILVLPALGAIGGRSATGLALAAVATLPTVLWWHRRMLRLRRRSRFLLMWLIVSTVLVLAVYENRVPHDRFASQVFGPLLFVATLSLARVLYTDPGCRALLSLGVADAAAAELRGARCPVSGVAVARFDHFCSWLDMPIGAANHRSYLSFVASIAAAAAVGGLSLAAEACASPPLRRRGDPDDAACAALVVFHGRSSVALAAACYAIAAAVLVGALLGFQCSLVARGVTHYELRHPEHAAHSAEQLDARAAAAAAPPPPPRGAFDRRHLGDFLRETAPICCGAPMANLRRRWLPPELQPLVYEPSPRRVRDPGWWPPSPRDSVVVSYRAG